MRKYIFTILKGVGYGIGIALASFFLSSCDVHALQVEPTDVRYYDTAGHILDHNSQSIGGYTFYYGTVPSNKTINTFRFIYSNNQFQSYANGKKYMVTFQVYSTSEMAPVVTFGTNGTTYTCYTSNAQYEIDSSGTGANSYNSGFTGVICPNVTLSNTVYVQLHYGSYNSGTVNQRYYISQNFSFAELDSQSQVINAIDDLEDQQQQTNEKLDDVNNSVNDVKDSITDSNVDDSTSTGSDFFSGFTTESHGLTGIVSSPLRLINSMTNQCSTVTIDFRGTPLNLPCGSYLFDREDVKPFVQIYNTIVGGLLAYGCARGIYKRVEDFKDPDNSKVEVLDL